MKRILSPVALVALLLPLAAGSAAAQQPTAKKPAVATKAAGTSTPPKTVATSKTPTATLEQDLRTFSNWVDAKLELQMATVRLDWGTLQSDYARMTKRLDAGLDSLSAQSRREYLGQQARYKAWAAENGHPVPETPLVGEAKDSAVTGAQRKLLNTTAPLNRAMAGALPDLYGRLIESTRVSYKRWTKTDWDAANLVLGRLNARYDQVSDQLQLEDRVRIRSLQAEFRTLEKARDLKGIFDGL